MAMISMNKNIQACEMNMKSLHKIYTTVLAFLLLFAGTDQMRAAVDEALKDKYISAVGSSVTSLTDGQWYLVQSNSNSSKYLQDPGTGSIGTGAAVTAESDAVANAGQLFYYSNNQLRSGNGLYLSLTATSTSGGTTAFTEAAATNTFNYTNNKGFSIQSVSGYRSIIYTYYRYLYLNNNAFAGTTRNGLPNGNNANPYYVQFLPVTFTEKSEPNVSFGGWNSGNPQVGGTTQIGVWGVSLSDLVLSSEDESIATVDASGLVTGVSSGTTNIILTYPGSVKVKDRVVKIQVTVDKATIYNANMSVSDTQVAVGETVQMTVTSASDGVVTFSSSDETKATVDANGVITGVAPGNVTISYAIGASQKYNAFAGGSQQITVKAASTTIQTDVYYIMDKTTGKFLTRGGSNGYQAIVAPYGLPWRVERNWDGSCKLSMYDMYKNGATSQCLGTGGTVNNTTSTYWTMTGDKTECTMAYNNKYLAINSNETINAQSSTANKWVLLSKSQYTAKLEEMRLSQEKSVGESMEIDLSSSSLSAVLKSESFITQDVTSQLESQPTNGGSWTATRTSGSTLNYGTYGSELYQTSGSYTQQVTGLEPGIYKVSIKALQRTTTNATSLSIGQEGYTLSEAYLSANGQTVNVKDWYSGRAGDANPNNTTQFVTQVNAGKYLSEVYTTVGADGILDLKVQVNSCYSYEWFCFYGVELTYYKDNRREPSTLVVSPSTLNLVAGASGAVTLDYGDWDGAAADITYSAPNASVASISGSGTSYSVKALGKGTTTITFTIPETKNYRAATATLTINVSLASTSLKFDISTLDLSIEDVSTHKATTTSASTGAITYSSSNEGVAKVDELTGKVTAIKIGTATITATLAATNQFAGATASYTLNVVRKQTTLQFKNLTNNTLNKIWGQEVTEGSTFNNAATTNSTATVEYSSDNTSVVTVNTSGLLTFHGIGSAVVTARVAQNDVYQAAELKSYIYVTDLNHYRLKLVNAPDRGVIVTIGSKTFTEGTDFAVSGEISASMVKVASISSYSTSVDVNLVSNNSTSNPHVITVTYTLIPPTAGRFYRISSYKTGSFLCCKESNVSGYAKNLALTKSQDQDALVFIDATNHALFYGNGQYMNASGQLVGVGQGTGTTVSFIAGDAANSGAFAIKMGSLYLHDATTHVDVDNKSVTGTTDWNVEQVNALPVTLSALGYGYGTLYCPVALQVPGGISAFTIHMLEDASSSIDRDYTLKLEQVIGIIPANTPVVIQGMPGATYEFPLVYSNTDAAIASADVVKGSACSLLTSGQETSGTVFTLQPTRNGSSVGFYPWKSSNTSGTYPQNVLQGFRLFIVCNFAGGAASFRFESDLNTTSIEGIEETGTTVPSYDMLGRQIDTRSKGLMIQSGKVVLKK